MVYERSVPEVVQLLTGFAHYNNLGNILGICTGVLGEPMKCSGLK
jgi:hypothetical protein